MASSKVNDAIAWINANYKSLEYRKELAFRHNLAYGINPVIGIAIYTPTPLSAKRILRVLLQH